VIAPDLAEAFNGKRVLVVGGLGFIGSNLADELVEAGARVHLVDALLPGYGGNRANVAHLAGRVEATIADVRRTDLLPNLLVGQDVLFNLAGQTSHLDSMRDPYTDLEINCIAQLSILETCRAHNPELKIVFASTRQIYGKPDYLPVDEAHPIRPVDVNGINKTAGEWYHLLYGQVYGQPVSVLRLTNTYGPRMRVADARQTFLGVWLRHAVTGEQIKVYGDGTQRRDLNYVDDAVRALLLVAARDEANGQVFNLGDEHVVDLRGLAELLIELNGSGSFELVPFPDDLKQIDIGDYYADYSKIRGRLGWEPRVPLEEGLRRSLDFYRRHGSAYWRAP
jgi:UDP-glucose 4-epimerase